MLGGMGTIWSDLVKAEIMHDAWPLMNAVAEQLWSPAARTALPGAPTGRYKDQCARLQQRGILNATECEPPPPLPPPPPPPPPVSCSPHFGVKLNNTKYADGNGPRTTPDAKGCCDLCSATAGCHHWAFQIDAAVAGKICHWATLTYCCWMHASDADPVSAVGWTSDVGTASTLKTDDYTYTSVGRGGASARLDDELDAFIEAKMASAHIPSVSLLVQRNSTLLWKRAYGYSNAFSTPPINASPTGTPYTMASVSKTVLATTLLTLFDQGLFGLDDDVNKYLAASSKASGFELRNPHHPNAPITFRQLLTHTSSINDRCWATASDSLFYTRGANNPWSVYDMLFG